MVTRSNSRVKAKSVIKGAGAAELAQLPPPNFAARLLPLEQMLDENFEFICVDLTEQEPGIVQADLKRGRGVPQYGADVEGFSDGHAPVLIVSAKRYQRVNASKLKEWGTDFLKHFDAQWKDKGVKRFVLAVTVELNNDDLNQAIREEKERFLGFDIKYEVWGLRQLTNKLRTLPRVISTYMHPAWVPLICDTSGLGDTSLISRDTSAYSSAAAGQATVEIRGAAEALKVRYGQEIGTQLEAALADLARGRQTPLDQLVSRVRRDAVAWESLESTIKARVLRAASTLALRDQDVAKARQLHSDAAFFSPAKDRSAEALILAAEDKMAEAVALIAKPATIQEAGLKIAILLEEGEAEQARQCWSDWPDWSADEAERARLKAFIDAVEGNYEDALRAINEATAIAPQRFSVIWASAIIRYNAAVSDALPFHGGSFPNPIVRAMIGEDEASRKSLAEAERLFERLAGEVDTSSRRSDLEVWRLACLLCHSGSSSEAEELFQDLLSRPLPHPGAIAWAMQFGMSFKPEPILKLFAIELDEGRGSASQLVVSALILARGGKRQRAQNLLKKWKPSFDEQSDRTLIDHWSEQLSGDHKIQMALADLYKKRDATGLLAIIDSGTLQLDAVVSCFEALLAGRKWKEANERRNLLRPVGTAGAFEMMAVAACNAGYAEDCIALLDEGTSYFPEGALSRRMKLLKADAHARMGRPDLAILTVDELKNSGEDPSELAFRSAWLRLNIGDIPGAAQQIKGRPVPASVGPEHVLQFAHEFRQQHPDVAKSMLENLAWDKLDARLTSAAFTLAAELGIAEGQRILTPKMKQLPAAAGKVWSFETLEEMLSWLEENKKKQDAVTEDLAKRWLALGIPLHLVFDRRPFDFARYFKEHFGQGNKADHKMPLLLRSGHQRIEDDGHTVATEIAARGLIVDTTALLVAHELGLVEHIEHLTSRVLVAPELPEALRSIELALYDRFGDLSESALAVEQTIQRASVTLIGETAIDKLSRLVVSGVDGKEGDVSIPALLAKLQLTGLDPETAAEALKRLGHPDVVASDKDLPTELAVSPRELILLAELGLVPSIMPLVSFSVSETDASAFHRDLREIREGRAHADKISRLRTFVSGRLSDGRWTLIPRSPPARRERKIRGSGPILRSLLSALRSTELMSDAPIVWAEDRYLSRFGALGRSPVVDTTQILGALRFAGKISDTGLTDHRRKLYRAGYGFLLPKPEECAEALLVAPVRQGVLQDTDRLKDLRAAAAQQLEYGRHLQDVPLGTNPAAGSEYLALTGVMGLAAKTIAAVWSSGATHQHKITMSSWAWQHLRIEQADYLPLEDKSPAAKEIFISLQHIGLATVIFSISGVSYEAALQTKRQFAEWAFPVFLDGRAKKIPGFEELLVNSLASFIELLFKEEAGETDEDKTIRRLMVQDYVSCLPNGWRPLIRNHALLRDKVEADLVEAVSIGNMTFRSETFFHAVKLASETGSATAPLLQKNELATFAPIRDEQVTGGTLAFTVSDDQTTISVADDMLALLLDDESARFAALARHGRWFDRTGSALESAIHEIVSLPSFDERRARLDAVRNTTVVNRLEKLSDDIASSRTEVADLLPPADPRALEHFLRINSETGWPRDLSTLAAESFDTLASESGPLHALRRVAALPVRLPDEAIRQIAEAAHACGSVDNLLAKIGPSPMASVAILRALSGRGMYVEGFNTKFVLESLRDKAGLVIAALRLSARSVSGKPDWEIPDWQRSALLWSHANGIADVLLRHHVDTNATITLLDRQGKADLGASFAHAKRPDFLTINDLLPDYFVAAAALEMWQVLPDNERSEPNLKTLRSLVSLPVAAHHAPIPELLVRREFSDAPGSWLSVDVGKMFHELGVIEMPAPFDERAPDRIAEKLVAEAITDGDAERSGAWPMLWLCEPTLISAQTRARVRELQTDHNIPELVNLSHRSMLSALTSRAELAGLDRDENWIEHDLRLLARALRHRLSVPERHVVFKSRETPGERLFMTLVEAIWTYAFSYAETFDATGQILSSAINIVCSEWPESHAACLHMLDVFSGQLPSSAAAPIWDLVNQLRLGDKRA